MERSQYLKIIDLFMSAYLKGDMHSIDDILADDIEIHYSTIGDYYGKEEVRKALLLTDHYDIHTTTITNEMSYIDGQYEVFGMIGHHLIGNEQGSEFYPLCFGGKYVFVFQHSLIEKIYYSQEYQVENTIYIKNWKLASHYSNLEKVKGFDLMKVCSHKQDEKTDIAQLVKAFFWAFDACDMDCISQIVSDDIFLQRQKTMAYGTMECHGLDHVSAFIQENKDYYSMDQFSITIRSITPLEDGYIVKGSHLIPHRVGTKKLNVHTKYSSFFDEDFIIDIKLTDGKYKISRIIFTKIVDVHLNGFEVLHYQ